MLPPASVWSASLSEIYLTLPAHRLLQQLPFNWNHASCWSCTGAGGPLAAGANGTGLAAKTPPLEPILAVSPHVAVSDTGFLLDGRPYFPSGTSWCAVSLLC